MKAETISDRSALYTSLLALAIALFSAGFNLAVGVANKRYLHGKGISFSLSYGGMDQYGDSTLWYLGVSACLLMVIPILALPTRSVLKQVALVLLMGAIIQSTFLVINKPVALPKWITDDSSLLGTIWYLDFILLGSLIGSTVCAYISLRRQGRRTEPEE